MTDQEKGMVTGKYWDRPWSLVENCTKVSPGCDHCWLQDINHRFHRDGPVTFREDRLDLPLRARKPKVWSIWSDLFHETVTDVQIDKAFTRMFSRPEHKFFVLTKRPERLQRWVADWNPGWQYKGLGRNIWFGVTGENQDQLKHRAWTLLQTFVPHRFVSIEPLLGPVDLNEPELIYEGWRKKATIGTYLDFVIVGPETGPKRRECRPEWIRSVVEQCSSASVPVWVKAFPVKGKISHDMAEWPEWARRRELPF